MKDSQRRRVEAIQPSKYIKANNERFSTIANTAALEMISISRRIMKDSQQSPRCWKSRPKYIKANNERFSTQRRVYLDHR